MKSGKPRSVTSLSRVPWTDDQMRFYRKTVALYRAATWPLPGDAREYPWIDAVRQGRA